MIISFVILASVLASLYSLRMPNVFRSEATIIPATQAKGFDVIATLGRVGTMIDSEAGLNETASPEQLNVVLKSRDLTKFVIEENDLLPVIFGSAWDAQRKKWKVDKPPTIQDAYNIIHAGPRSMLKMKLDPKKNILRMSFEMEDPKMAQAFLDYFVTGLSEFLRNQALDDAMSRQVHLSQQLTKTSDPILKNKLYELIARQIEKETMSRVKKYYGFNVIDRPYVPERRFAPNREQICVLSAGAAFVISILIAFFLEYLRKLRAKEEPKGVGKGLATLRAVLQVRRRTESYK